MCNFVPKTITPSTPCWSLHHLLSTMTTTCSSNAIVFLLAFRMVPGTTPQLIHHRKTINRTTPMASITTMDSMSTTPPPPLRLQLVRLDQAFPPFPPSYLLSSSLLLPSPLLLSCNSLFILFIYILFSIHYILFFSSIPNWSSF